MFSFVSNSRVLQFALTPLIWNLYFSMFSCNIQKIRSDWKIFSSSKYGPFLLISYLLSWLGSFVRCAMFFLFVQTREASLVLIQNPSITSRVEYFLSLPTAENPRWLHWNHLNILQQMLFMLDKILKNGTREPLFHPSQWLRLLNKISLAKHMWVKCPA